jgi:hypothetical protein
MCCPQMVTAASVCASRSANTFQYSNTPVGYVMNAMQSRALVVYAGNDLWSNQTCVAVSSISMSQPFVPGTMTMQVRTLPPLRVWPGRRCRQCCQAVLLTMPKQPQHRCLTSAVSGNCLMPASHSTQRASSEFPASHSNHLRLDAPPMGPARCMSGICLGIHCTPARVSEAGARDKHKLKLHEM